MPEDAETASYAELGLLGRGVYGEAILVQNRRTGEKVVVKHVPLDGLDETEVNNALKEVSALQLLEHPNIVRCFGSWVTAGGGSSSLRPWDQGNESARLPVDQALATWEASRSFVCGPTPSSLNILTEYMDGGSLDKLLERNCGEDLDESLVGVWVAQLALAIDHMHTHKVLHRDIKPANVFISKSGVVKLGDLGCCMMLERPDEQCASDYGSPLYLSPEVWRSGVCSHKSDIWATGCVAYELLAQHPPFAAPELAYKVINQPPPRLPDCYSAELHSLVGEMLQKDADRRPSSVALLRNPALAPHIAQWMRICRAPTPTRSWRSSGSESRLSGSSDGGYGAWERHGPETGGDALSATELVQQRIAQLTPWYEPNYGRAKVA